MECDHGKDEWDHAEEAVTRAFIREAVRRIAMSIGLLVIPLGALLIELGLGVTGIVVVPNRWLRIAGILAIVSLCVVVTQRRIKISANRGAATAVVDLRSTQGERLFSFNRLLTLILHLPLMILAGYVFSQMTSRNWGIGLTVLLVVQHVFALVLTGASNRKLLPITRFTAGGEKPTWEA